MTSAMVDIKPKDLPPMGPGDVTSFSCRHAEMCIALRCKKSDIPELGLGPNEEPDFETGKDGHSVIPTMYSEGSNLHDSDRPICIIGAGMSGLYAAMILQDLKLNFEILEASPRIGGRAFTHRFSETTSFHDYFDVGAMRFPNSKIMKRTFELMKRVGLGDVDNKDDKGKLIPYLMEADNTINMYNGIRIVKSKEEDAKKIKEKQDEEKDKNGDRDIFGFEVCTVSSLCPVPSCL